LFVWGVFSELLDGTDDFKGEAPRNITDNGLKEINAKFIAGEIFNLGR